MSDDRLQLIKRIESELAPILSADAFETAIDSITRALSDFNVEKACTEIVPYSGINERLINTYSGCLLISGKSEKTIAQYRRTVSKFSEFINKIFLEVGVYDIRLFLAAEKHRGVSNRTLENTRANLSAFFQWLQQEEHISKNPCLNVQPIKYPDKVRLPFSTVEVDSLRFACKNAKERAIIEVLLSTGVRVSELAGLLITDINFNDLSVHVRKGKGAKERTVYMNDLARTHLQNYLMERHDSEESLFINVKGEPLNPGGVRYLLNQIGDRAGVDNVHPHRFRRTFATGLASRGMKIQEVQKLLGHSNINTTLEYVFTSDESAHASYQKYVSA